MLAARYVQQPFDRRKRVLDYDPWLQAAETIASVTITADPTTETPFTITPIVVDSGGRKVAYYAGGGESGNIYTLTVRIVTSNGQSREDEVEIEVEET